MKKNHEIESQQTRSGKYQYLILEVPVGDEVMGSFTNSNSILYHLNPFFYDERVELLWEELKQLVRTIIDTQLTDLQKKVILMRMDGYTQCEISDALNVLQSSVHKSLFGNITYVKGGGIKKYGGTINKMKKLLAKNERIQEILLEIAELQQERL